MADLLRTTVETGDVCVIRLEGEIDLSNAPGLREQISETMPPDSIAMVLDLAGLTYMDSRGVSLLFELARSLQTRRQRLLVVVPATSPLSRLFEVTKLSQAIPMAPTLDAAKARVAELANDPLG